MDRIDIIQAALNATGRGTYLEIGVCTGSSFIPIHARHKWGVDPDHALSWKRIVKYKIFSLMKIKQEKIFKETSDEFFERRRFLPEIQGINVAFVDGLHTYQQVLRDVQNCLKYLQPNGIILIHDCSPMTVTAATPAADISEVASLCLPGWDGAWNGDVWKVVVHLRALRDDLTTFVLDCDQGVGVVVRGVSDEKKLSYTEPEIQKMDFKFLEKNRDMLLGLRRPEYFREFLSTHGRE